MKRIHHLLIIIIPPILIGLFVKDEHQMIRLAMWHIAFVIPIATIYRMRYFGYGTKGILRSFIPFYGMKNRYQIFSKERMEIKEES